MRCRALRSTWFVSFYQTASDYPAENNFLKRCLDHMWKNVLPTIFILICSSMFTLYVSELIYRAKLHPTELKPAQASHFQDSREPDTSITKEINYLDNRQEVTRTL